MATRSKTKSEAIKFQASSTPAGRKKILEAYANYWAEHNAPPTSVAAFCRSLKVKEADFYKHFASLEGVEKNIWLDWMDSVITAVSSGKEWKGFSARERYLAFLFALIESATKHRSLLLQRLRCSMPMENPIRFEGLRTSFLEFAKEIIQYGQERGEIASRPGTNLLYPGILYIHLRWVLHFYLKDESDSFERTDAFIEKTVNFAFDLFRTQAIDSATDLVRFLLCCMEGRKGKGGKQV